MYESHLQNGTSKAGDLYSRRTIEGYVEVVDVFAKYLARTGFAGDFTDVESALLGRSSIRARPRP